MALEWKGKIPASGDSLSTSQGQISGNFTLIEGALGSSTLSSGITKAQGDVFYADDAQFIKKLAKNATAQRVLSNSGTNNNPQWGQVSLTAGVVGTLPIANGGTGSTATTYLDLLSNVYGILPEANGGTGRTASMAASGGYNGSNGAQSIPHGLGRQPVFAFINNAGGEGESTWLSGMNSWAYQGQINVAGTVDATNLVFGAGVTGNTNGRTYRFLVI